MDGWDEWMKRERERTAKYVVMTSKHHEGFTNWPNNQSWGWNAWDIGPKRDLVGELSEAVKGQDMHMGLYFSLFEWFNPIYLNDKEGGFITAKYRGL